MKYAVLKYKFIKERPAGIPLEWPYSARELPDASSKRSLMPNEILMTTKEFMEYKSQLQPAYNAWLRSVNGMPQTPEEKVKDRILAAMNFGRELIAEYGSQNVLRGLSVQEIKLISLKLSGVQALLLSGSLYAALDEMDHIETDNLVTQESINYFKSKIRSYLGI